MGDLTAKGRWAWVERPRDRWGSNGKLKSASKYQRPLSPSIHTVDFAGQYCTVLVAAVLEDTERRMTPRDEARGQNGFFCLRRKTRSEIGENWG